MNNTTLIPIIPFKSWTWGTPTLPALYWDVYSQEERWKKLCLQLEKTRAYVDYVSEIVRLNLEEMMRLFAETVKSVGYNPTDNTLVITHSDDTVDTVQLPDATTTQDGLMTKEQVVELLQLRTDLTQETVDRVNTANVAYFNNSQGETAPTLGQINQQAQARLGRNARVNDIVITSPTQAEGFTGLKIRRIANITPLSFEEIRIDYREWAQSVEDRLEVLEHEGGADVGIFHGVIADVPTDDTNTVFWKTPVETGDFIALVNDNTNVVERYVANVSDAGVITWVFGYVIDAPVLTDNITIKYTNGKLEAQLDMSKFSTTTGDTPKLYTSVDNDTIKYTGNKLEAQFSKSFYEQDNNGKYRTKVGDNTYYNSEGGLSSVDSSNIVSNASVLLLQADSGVPQMIGSAGNYSITGMGNVLNNITETMEFDGFGKSWQYWVFDGTSWVQGNVVYTILQQVLIYSTANQVGNVVAVDPDEANKFTCRFGQKPSLYSLLSGNAGFDTFNQATGYAPLFSSNVGYKEMTANITSDLIRETYTQNGKTGYRWRALRDIIVTGNATFRINSEAQMSSQLTIQVGSWGGFAAAQHLPAGDTLANIAFNGLVKRNEIITVQGLVSSGYTPFRLYPDHCNLSITVLK